MTQLEQTRFMQLINVCWWIGGGMFLGIATIMHYLGDQGTEASIRHHLNALFSVFTRTRTELQILEPQVMWFVIFVFWSAYIIFGGVFYLMYRRAKNGNYVSTHTTKHE